MTRISSEQAVRILDDVESVETLVRTVQDYLAHRTPAELSTLPENCRPDVVRSIEDVHWWADTISVEHESGEIVPRELQDMHEVFQSAVRRLRLIATPGTRDTGGT